MLNKCLSIEYRGKIALAFLLNIGLAFTVILILNDQGYLGKGCRKNCGHCKSKKISRPLKEIGFVVADFFVDRSKKFPQSPEEFKFTIYMTKNGNPVSWSSLNESSPFYFLCDENSYYSATAEQPLAISKKTFTNLYAVLFEDGHIKWLKAEDAINFIIYKLGKNWRGANDSLRI